MPTAKPAFRLPDDLQPNDILLYKPSGVFGTLIAIKTWHKISHVELYDGQQRAWASRDGLGVARYPVRLDGLVYVLRPTRELDLAAGRRYATSMVGTPYGWWDLLDFAGFNVDAPGIVCSPFVAALLRAEGWHIFPTDPPNKIAPFQFLDVVNGDLKIVWQAQQAV